MVSEEMLAELGFKPGDISEFFRFGEEKQFAAQKKLLRRYRDGLLQQIHGDEKRITHIDYLIHEIEKQTQEVSL